MCLSIARTFFEQFLVGFDRFGECWFGRTEMDAPDIDGKVFFTSENPLSVGQYVKIRITDTLD
ncbi:MAG TPA: 30S ribosomal protein S12 methylthiotransferase RimO, partial [Candidatus Rifleibacterium sp.]|nr:30S ribosomal protein S12 methylthiotransferase RimO [Candidatus Rifleibacterium sp.]